MTPLHIQPLALEGRHIRLEPLTLKARTRKVVVGVPESLLFLRRQADGRCEPVSGRIDPQLAVREVYNHPPLGWEGEERP